MQLKEFESIARSSGLHVEHLLSQMHSAKSQEMQSDARISMLLLRQKDSISPSVG
jgi:hypothetical protein